VLCERLNTSDPGGYSRVLGTWPTPTRTTFRRHRRASNVAAAARNPHCDAGILREIVWTSNALLDGRIDLSESVIAAAYQHLGPEAWRLALIAFAIQGLAIPLSLFGPVPINRIIKWTPQSLPNDSKEQEHRWDVHHWVRTFGLIVGFAAPILSAMIRWRKRKKTQHTC
jgi:hypothetical protein